jgi:hypothetical protein
MRKTLAWQKPKLNQTPSIEKHEVKEIQKKTSYKNTMMDLGVWTIIRVDFARPNLHKPHILKLYLHAYINTYCLYITSKPLVEYPPKMQQHEPNITWIQCINIREKHSMKWNATKVEIQTSTIYIILGAT